MFEDHSTTAADGSPAEENPIGEVTIPLRRREIARAQALAGVTLGLTAMFGLLAGWETSSTLV